MIFDSAKIVDKRSRTCYNAHMRKPDYLTQSQTRKYLSVSARTAMRLIELHGVEFLGDRVLPFTVAEEILKKRGRREAELEKRLAPIRRQRQRAEEFARCYWGG